MNYPGFEGWRFFNLLVFVLLVGHFLKKRRRDLSVTPDAIRALQGYAWPGNIRELENAVERAAILATGGAIEAGDFSLGTAPADALATAPLHRIPPGGIRSPAMRITDRTPLDCPPSAVPSGGRSQQVPSMGSGTGRQSLTFDMKSSQ